MPEAERKERLLANRAFLPSLPKLRLERGAVLCFHGVTAISNVFELRLGLLALVCRHLSDPAFGRWPGDN